MSTIDKLNNIEVEEILKALQIKFKEHNGTFFLYEGFSLTGGWKASRSGKFNDFSEKGRAKGDRLQFIQEYLSCSKHEALVWAEETFNIENTFKGNGKLSNPIKDKWDRFGELSEQHISFLEGREIDYEKLRGIVRQYGNNLALPIKTPNGNIKSIQSRSIGNTGSRYYVEANTDSDGIFISDINPDKRALVVVEGFTDFLSLRQYTTNVVGLLNAKNEGQLQMIKELSLSYDIYFIPDNDEAGKVTIEKFNKLGIKHNLFKLEDYGVKDVNDLLTQYKVGEGILREIRENSEKPLTNLQSALLKAKDYAKLYEENDGQLGFPSGYSKLDKYTGGIIKGKVYMIMAYSNVGKTRFAYSFLKNLIKEKKKVHFYSLEVDTGMLFLEMIGAVKGITKNEVLSKLDNISLEGIEEYVEIYDDIRSLKQIETHIRNDKPEVAIIDFIQNIEQPGREYDKMTEIALRIQKLAILTGTTIIQLSQVANESRFADGNSILPKGSGALFASSDVIFTLWAREGEKYLTLSKNKFGPVGMDFLLEIDYAKSNFKMTEDVQGLVGGGSFSGLK